MPKAPNAPAAKPALALKKPAAPAKPAFTPAIGDVVAFAGYETENDAPLIQVDEFVKITNIDKTAKGRVRYYIDPITDDGSGGVRTPDTAFASEIRPLAGDEEETVATLLAQAGEGEITEETEDYAALGSAADGGDESSAARLTEIATEAGLDPNDYESWALLAEALTPVDEDLDELATQADEGDEDAAARLTELCEENEVDLTPFAETTWAEVIPTLTAAMNGEEAPALEEEAPEAPAPRKTAPASAKAGVPAKAGATPAKKAPVNSKKATAAPKAPKLALTESMQRVLTENNNDLLAAMQQTERQIGQNFLDLGGLIKLGEIQNAHQMVIDPATGKPQFENTKKGYYEWVKANLETDERVARHLAKIYQVFIAKLKFAPEGLLALGISKLREIAPIAIKLAKEDKEANAALKAAGKAEDSAILEDFLQEANGLVVRDLVAKVRAVKGIVTTEGGNAGGNLGGVIGGRVVTLQYRLFDDQAAFVKTVLQAAMTDLPDAEKNEDKALFRIFSEYAASAGLPAYEAAKPKTVAKKTATAKPAPVAAPAKPAAKKAVARPGK